MGKTLKFGGGVWATKKGSTLAYNDEGGNFKPLPFTYTGAGKGTRVNKEGLIEVVENDRPRIDYLDSEDGVFLLEKAATNLVTYSEAFDNSYWTKDGASVTDGQSSPDGRTNAYKLTENSSNGIHRVGRAVFSANVERTLSVFAKKGERNFISLFENNTASPAIKGVIFNLDNGTYYNNNSSFYYNVKIELVSNGWYRCSATSNNTGLQVPSIGVSADGFTNSYQGDGTSGVYIFGAMLEQSSQSSSYIPTQGSIQTRVQETASGSGNSEVFNDSQGVLFVNTSSENTVADNRIYLSDGSDNNRIFIILDKSQSSIKGYVRGTAGYALAITKVGYDVSLSHKILIKYKSNDYSFWINGFEVGSEASSTILPSGLNQLSFNGTSNYNPFYGKTKEIAYYDTALTDLELETLTSYRSWLSMVKELNLNIIHNE